MNQKVWAIFSKGNARAHDRFVNRPSRHELARYGYKKGWNCLAWKSLGQKYSLKKVDFLEKEIAIILSDGRALTVFDVMKESGCGENLSLDRIIKVRSGYMKESSLLAPRRIKKANLKEKTIEINGKIWSCEQIMEKTGCHRKLVLERMGKAKRGEMTVEILFSPKLNRGCYAKKVLIIEEPTTPEQQAVLDEYREFYPRVIELENKYFGHLKPVVYSSG